MRLNLKNRNMQKGFTLVELMIAIAIIGILASIGTPIWQETMRNIRLKSDAQVLLASLQWAKGEAARRNTCIGINFTTSAFPAAGGNYIVFVDGDCNQAQGAAVDTLRTVTMERDVSLQSANVGVNFPQALCFTSNAVTCGSEQGNVQVRNANRWYRAIISASAGVRLERSTDGLNWN